MCFKNKNNLTIKLIYKCKTFFICLFFCKIIFKKIIFKKIIFINLIF